MFEDPIISKAYQARMEKQWCSDISLPYMYIMWQINLLNPRQVVILAFKVYWLIQGINSDMNNMQENSQLVCHLYNFWKFKLYGAVRQKVYLIQNVNFSKCFHSLLNQRKLIFSSCCVKWCLHGKSTGCMYLPEWLRFRVTHGAARRSTAQHR